MRGARLGDDVLTRAKASEILPRVGRREAGRVRSAIQAGLEARRTEIEQALLTRVYGIADPTEVGDFTYVDGFRSAASAAFDFALATLESSQDRLPLVPPVLLSQARLAARNAVPLDTILRRYTAGHALLVDFLIDEVERQRSLPAYELRRILATSSSALDRLLAAVGEEHAREIKSRHTPSRDRRLAERIERLLAGEQANTTELNYDFGTHHIALIAVGMDTRATLKRVAAEIECQLLLVQPEETTTWAWLGRGKSLASDEIASAIRTSVDFNGARTALGEPAKGLNGWRLTHRQAAAALVVAKRADRALVRYGDVVLLAALFQDDLPVTSLRQIYLAPLESEPDGGQVLRQTLQAYFSHGRNGASTAASLGVSRQTVSNRLRTIERRVGRSRDSWSADFEIALSAAEMGAHRTEAA